MKQVFVAMLIGCLSFGAMAQDDRVLMTIEKDEVTVNEFLSIYNKNNTSTVVDKKTMEEYLDLFLNFKLKVKAAEELGMDTAPKFINELEGYRRQLAQPYLVDRETNDHLILEGYNRMQQDVDAYHILVKLPEDASPKDTLAALKRIKKIAKEIQTEKDMQLAMGRIRNANDGSVIAEDLGYFTAFSMVYPFENAAYATEEGKLSDPVRTRFGYHVVFVKDKRQARGEVKVSHIMIKANAEMSDEERVRAKEKADEIYQRVKGGEDFKTLAQEYSDDNSSAKNGGQLPWFGTGRMVQAFEDAAFELQENGQVTEPVQTNFGWHIIQRDDYRGIGTFDELKTEIKKRIERDSRGQKGRLSLLKKLKEEYTLSFNYKMRNAVDKLVPSEYLTGKWTPEQPEGLAEVVLIITDNKYSKMTQEFTQLDYFDYLRKFQRKYGANETTSDALASQWDGFVNACIIDFENDALPYKYPEYKALVQEYHDGILLFDLMDQKVWSKAVKDTTGLDAFYAASKQNYMWDERVDASVYLCENEEIAKKTMKLAKKRLKKGYADNDILEMVNKENPLNLTIRSGLYTKGEDEYIDQAPWAAGLHQVDGNNGKKVIVQIYAVKAPEPKALSECRGLVTSDYQSQLEKEWIDELRAKYSHSINMDVFQTIDE